MFDELNKADRQRLADAMFLELTKRHAEMKRPNLTKEERESARTEYEETLRLFQTLVKGVKCPCCGGIVA